jgi:RNA polymerase sigma-70 factor (ECF subfamily)
MSTCISRQLESDTIAPRAIGNEWVMVQRAIAGDANAKELLFAPHMHRLYRVAFAILHNEEDAEDAMQNGLCRACNCLRYFQGRSSFSTWLTRIVINSALMTIRRKKSHRESSLDEVLDNRPDWLGHVAADKRPNPEQVYALVELNALIEKQIRKLPAPEQTAFRHFAINGFSMKESWQSLGIPGGTFKSRIFRTRRKLAHGLQSSLDGAYVTSRRENSIHVAQR